MPTQIKGRLISWRIQYAIYAQEVLKKMHKGVPTDKNDHIFFYEQAVYKKGTKTKKGLIDLYWTFFFNH